MARSCFLRNVWRCASRGNFATGSRSAPDHPQLSFSSPPLSRCPRNLCSPAPKLKAIYTADTEKYPVLFSGQKNKLSGVNGLHLNPFRRTLGVQRVHTLGKGALGTGPLMKPFSEMERCSNGNAPLHCRIF